LADPQNEKLEQLFSAALEKDTPGEREAFLDGACGDDADLRTQVQELLRVHGEVGSFLDVPPVDPNATVEYRPTHAADRTRIGRYKILQEIGEGGFGIVHMAEQQEPVRRKVALKIIKLGMDTKQVIARFEAERQALALMDHPNIARVLDAGATETGRPYFVMELVRGITITGYCDQNKLSAAERLELFLPVCHAVQHAHQKGIIHRDLKPNNVLVTLHDAKPVPKVIDFGIAKATSQRLTEKTLFTGFRQFLGTPEYMSPDQAEISGLDVDTRTDIYSLGVLLYELLTGTTPFDAKTLRGASYDEILRTIREVEPPTPSARLHTLSATQDAAAIARLRRSEPAALSRQLRGDLDWIAMKAMEKDRTRRYQTANDLAADIERHLRNEPVIAGPPGPAYKFSKFVRRHRFGVLGGSVVGAALLIGLSMATAGLIQANRARAALEVERDAATAARAAEQEQRTIAEASANDARAQATKSQRALHPG
jgi:serine/threonine protein kinase